MEDVIEMENTPTVPNNELEQRYIRYKDVIKELTIMNDIFMRNVFKKRERIEHVLRIIMEMKNLQVLDYTVQKDYKNLQGRSAILDCVARDDVNNQYNVEIQQDTEGASPKRARYHSGLMDMNTLNSGQDYDELPESYVIFITRDDVLGYGLSIYHIERKIRENDEIFQDGAHIIYVYSKKQEDTELGRLMHDLHCKNANDMYSEVLAKRVSELKETETEESVSMCDALEKLIQEFEQKGELQGEARGIAKGAIKKAKETAKALSQEGMPVQKIAQILGEEGEIVRNWLEEEK